MFFSGGPFHCGTTFAVVYKLHFARLPAGKTRIFLHCPGRFTYADVNGGDMDYIVGKPAAIRLAADSNLVNSGERRLSSFSPQEKPATSS